MSLKIQAHKTKFLNHLNPSILIPNSVVHLCRWLFFFLIPWRLSSSRNCRNIVIWRLGTSIVLWSLCPSTWVHQKTIYAGFLVQTWGISRRTLQWENYVKIVENSIKNLPDICPKYRKNHRSKLSMKNHNFPMDASVDSLAGGELVQLLDWPKIGVEYSKMD